MPTDHRAALASIKRFDQLIAYLRDEMGWPIGRDSFEEVDDLFYDFTADELGIDPKTAAKIQEIKRLRPLSPRQPWGIFFVKFEPKRLPVVALRRILGQVAMKKRASANSAERAAWAADDLLFVSNYGEGEERQISFAHFSRAQDGHDLPTLRVLGWDNRDTALHLDAVARELTAHLGWPDDDTPADAWRTRWRAAFTLGHREVVTTSKDLSIRLAELARAIRDRTQTALKIETEMGPLTRLMKAFQTALVHDLDADGFADMYAQTIAYGLLSSRIADPHKKTADDFAAHMRTNPFLRELMETFLKVGGRRGKAGGPGIDFDELGVSEVVDLLDAANMEAVVRDFGDRNPQEDPVIHFYELFLKEYDAKKRMQRGVFYTPRPVVSYIVRSVDELLRTEFGLADGLADTTTWGQMAKRHKDLKIPEGVSPGQDFVQILDPATGTGTFLVEVIDLIYRTLTAKWEAQGHAEKKIDEMWNEYVPKHLLTRLHGYELLMAPYAIAHLKIGLKLYETGYGFGSDERARIYLTNALEPAQDFSGRFDFAIPALAHEATAVNAVKEKGRFTVVIGNPPYSVMSANLSEWARNTVQHYKLIDGQPLKEKSMLRLEVQLQDDYIKFIARGQASLELSGSGILALIVNHSFVDNPTLRGLRHSLGASFAHLRVCDLHGNSRKKNDAIGGHPNENVFDIQQGVAILIGVCLASDSRRVVLHADIHGTRESKYERLSSSRVALVPVKPTAPLFLFSSLDDTISAEWSQFCALTDLFPRSSGGIMSGRDEFAFDFEREPLLTRVAEFCDPRNSDDWVRSRFRIKDASGYKLAVRRRSVVGRSPAELVIRAQFRPFDYRFVAYSRGFLTADQISVMQHLIAGRNVALVATRQTKENWGVFVTRHVIERKFVGAYDPSTVFPAEVIDMHLGAAVREPNLPAEVARSLSKAVGIERTAKEFSTSVFHYVYAVLNSARYRNRYGALLLTDYARVPLSTSKELFQALSQLGRALASAHLLELESPGPRTDQFIGRSTPEVAKIRWSRNTVWLDEAQTTGFTEVGEDVWNFHIGGYQVCEKWLKDRKGRTLSKDDIAHYQKIVVALSETIRLMKEVDEVIEQRGGWPGAFQTSATPTGEATVAPATVAPFRPRSVAPRLEERYVTCLPLVPLKVAAGAFSNPQHIEDDDFEWVEVESRHRLRKGMFVAQVVGKSMEPTIPDGAYCLFRAPVEGTRQGKNVLAVLRDVADPETGERYTVKRYESEKVADGDEWRHERITLKPVNPAFEPIVLGDDAARVLGVPAEFLEVVEPRVGSGATEGAEPSARTRRPAREAAPQMSLLSSPEDGQEEPRPDGAARVSVNAIDPDDLPVVIRQVFSDRQTRDRESAIRDVRQAFGLERTGSRIREVVDNGLRTAVRRGILRNAGDGLALGTARIEDYDRAFLKEQFLASLEGRRWRDRSEVARALARWLGFARTGSVIEESVKSIINGLIREGRLETRESEIRRAD